MTLPEHIETMQDAIHELGLQEQICDELKAELEWMIDKINEVLFCVEAIRPGMSERMRAAISQDADEKIKGSTKPNRYLSRLIDVLMADSHLSPDERP